MTGWLRSIYNFLGLEYIGTKEQNDIEKQTRLKFILHKQIRETDLDLFLFKRVIKNTKKRNKNKNKIVMGIPVKINKLPELP
jgi:L-2-hydroxyglutarate oxidase LhgO